MHIVYYCTVSKVTNRLSISRYAPLQQIALFHVQLTLTVCNLLLCINLDIHLFTPNPSSYMTYTSSVEARKINFAVTVHQAPTVEIYEMNNLLSLFCLIFYLKLKDNAYTHILKI